MITVKVSSKGQIAIPKSIRTEAGFKEGSRVEVRLRGRDVILRKSEQGTWRRWRGVLKGTRALAEHEREHRDELAADRR